MYAPDDPFAVRRPAPPVAEPEAEPAPDHAPAETVANESGVELLDRAEATYDGAARVIDLVDAGDLDRAESVLDALVAPPSE